MEGYIQTTPGSAEWKHAYFSEVFVRDAQGNEIARPLFDRFITHGIMSGTAEEIKAHLVRKLHGKVEEFQFEDGLLCYGVLSERTPPSLRHVLLVGFRKFFRRSS